MRAVLVVVGLLVATAAQAETRTCKFPGYPVMKVDLAAYSASYDGSVQFGAEPKQKLIGAGSVGTGQPGRVYLTEDEKYRFVFGGSVDRITADYTDEHKHKSVNGKCR